MTHVSCIVVCHDESLLLVPTLRSVQASVDFARESGLTVDIHIVLDRADPATINAARANIEKGTNFHEVEYGDLALSRNHGIRKATGEYIGLIDGDDLWCDSWVLDSYLTAASEKRMCVYHPEYNFVFGNSEDHIFMHVDMEDPDFEFGAIFRSNYWTALSFAKRQYYIDLPFEKNRLSDGFGYEDWTWNYKIIGRGAIHKVVRGTSHYVRRKPKGSSLLSKTNLLDTLPSFLPVYQKRRNSERV